MYEYLDTSNGRWVRVSEDHVVASVTTILNVIHKPVSYTHLRAHET